MGNKDSLGDRMKQYESVPKIYLTRRIPTIIRVDGKAFHTFTRGMRKPFDSVLMETMQKTMQYLCENVQGCVLGYTQSDEITLVLTDYATIATDSWFGYSVQKMVSIAASMATLAFNKAFSDVYSKRLQDIWQDKYANNIDPSDEVTALMGVYDEAEKRGALFDARVFSLPKDEVANCLIWRQQDATRNSIEAVGQANFSQSQLNGVSCDGIQDMLWKQRGINWNDFPVACKRGSCCVKVPREIEVPDHENPGKTKTIERLKWAIDYEPPIFTQDRDYIERLL